MNERGRKLNRFSALERQAPGSGRQALVELVERHIRADEAAREAGLSRYQLWRLCVRFRIEPVWSNKKATH